MSLFGLRFIKVQPTTYVLQFSRGKLVREGAGLAFYYFAPTTSLVAVPMASTEAPFMFSEVTADFQEVTIQGQVTYRVSEPKRIASLMNFTLDAAGTKYVSEDPHKLSQRVTNEVQVLTRAEAQKLPLRDAVRASDALVPAVLSSLRVSESIAALGLEVLGLAILAVKPVPEVAKALEAEARQSLLREADQAVYARRKAAIEEERAIKESELATEVAVENKKRQVREAQMDAERAVQEKKRQMEEADVTARIVLEKKKEELVDLSARNAKAEADAKAYGISAMVKPLAEVDPKVLQALASVGMDSRQLIALAFRELSENAGKIGQLNVSPDLLQTLLATGAK